MHKSPYLLSDWFSGPACRVTAPEMGFFAAPGPTDPVVVVPFPDWHPGLAPQYLAQRVQRSVDGFLIF